MGSAQNYDPVDQITEFWNIFYICVINDPGEQKTWAKVNTPGGVGWGVGGSPVFNYLTRKPILGYREWLEGGGKTWWFWCRWTWNSSPSGVKFVVVGLSDMGGVCYVLGGAPGVCKISKEFSGKSFENYVNFREIYSKFSYVRSPGISKWYCEKTK